MQVSITKALLIILMSLSSFTAKAGGKLKKFECYNQYRIEIPKKNTYFHGLMGYEKQDVQATSAKTAEVKFYNQAFQKLQMQYKSKPILQISCYHQ